MRASCNQAEQKPKFQIFVIYNVDSKYSTDVHTQTYILALFVYLASLLINIDCHLY